MEREFWLYEGIRDSGRSIYDNLPNLMDIKTDDFTRVTPPLERRERVPVEYAYKNKDGGTAKVIIDPSEVVRVTSDSSKTMATITVDLAYISDEVGVNLVPK